MTAATKKVNRPFQIVKPSNTVAMRPAGAKSWGETVASADGEAKLPVKLAMLTILGSQRSQSSGQELKRKVIANEKGGPNPRTKREKSEWRERGERTDWGSQGRERQLHGGPRDAQH